MLAPPKTTLGLQKWQGFAGGIMMQPDPEKLAEI